MWPKVRRHGFAVVGLKERGPGYRGMVRRADLILPDERMIAAGIAASLAAAVANAFALVLQAAEDRQAPLSKGGRISLLIGLAHRARWIAGTALMVVAWPLQVLANALAGGHVGFGILWLAATLAFGARASLEKTTALQRRPTVTVAPVIGAIHDPLPALMALWSGVAVWGTATPRVASLLVGLAVIGAGAAILGRSTAVARISAGVQMAGDDRRGGCRGCSQNRSWAYRVRREPSLIDHG
jgi:hypothetical protein